MAAAEASEGFPKPVEDVLFNYLRDVLYNPQAAKLDIESLPENFRTLGKGLLYFSECVVEATAFAKALSRGELDLAEPSRGNEIAAPLKSLKASLRHLTWQTQQVAKGDYKQRVDFMGEFSNSFNMMIKQLDQRQEALLKEIEINQKKTEALEQNNSLLEAITRHISQWIAVIAKESGKWLYTNREPEKILSDANSWNELITWLSAHLKNAQDGVGQTIAELVLPGGHGSQYFSVVIHPLHWYENDAVAFVFTDVSSEKRHLHRLETVAYHDTLTKVFNRHYGMEILTQWMGEGESFIICFVDIDNLKYVNDNFGHSEGDKYILKIVDILRGFSESTLICRLGGDEFMLLSRDYTVEEAEAKLENLRNILVSCNNESDNLYYHSLSYGIVGVETGNTLSASELLGIADEKMYKYKREHKMQRASEISPAPNNLAAPEIQ
ncbi:MAG: diguanylate cyclase [Synergistaceae bacterium]|jgi:diguanylate cyclase (GGDEF)-like protein|nr:diguanylate cyclase [Synergistaceae bacterium]